MAFNNTSCTADCTSSENNLFRNILAHIFFAESIAIFLLNSVCLLIIFSGRKLLLKKNLQNIYLSGLLLSHGGNGLSDILAYVTRGISWKAVFVFNSIRYTFYVTASCYTFLLSLDRYLAIKSPFYYQTISTLFIINSNLAVIFCTLMFAVLFLLNELYGAFFGIVFMLIVSTMLGVFNAIMYFELRKKFRAIKSMSVHNSREDHDNSKKKTSQRQVRALKLCVFIAVSYMIFWLPFMLAAINAIISGEDTDANLSHFLQLFALLDSIIDPLICIYLNKTVKQKIRSFFRI